LKARGFGLSDFSFYYMGIFYTISMWLLLILFIPLSHFFPTLKEYEWIFIFPFLIPFCILILIYFLFFFYNITLNDKEIVLSLFSIPFRTIPVSNLRLFCTVGNEREDVLCLTSHTIEELSFLEEKRLLGNFFTKHEVSFLKKKADYQDRFARKYLNRIRRNFFSLFIDTKTIFIKMDPILQHRIRELYIDLPYKNYTGITTYNNNPYIDKTKIPSFIVTSSPCFFKIKEDSIVVKMKKVEKQRIKLSEVKTIVRVDIFKAYHKYFPHHTPILYLSTFSQSEILQKTLKHEENELHTIYRYAEKEAFDWSVKKDYCCNLPYTPEVISSITALCPNAKWIDISQSWIDDKS